MKKYQVCYDACAALDYLHSTNYIHREVKVENFFVISASKVVTIAERRSRAVTNLPPPHSSDIIIKLGDFGETKLYRPQSSLVSNERLPMGGTPGYQAPELLDPKRFNYYYSKSIDIYALGITLWEIWMDGVNVYTGKSKMDIDRGVMENNLRPDTKECRAKSVPDDVIDIMEWAWDSDPEKRPSAKQLMGKFEYLMSESNEDIRSAELLP